jgi:TolB-like protein
LTKDALFESVWDGMIVSESALTSVIKELRRALGDQISDPMYIESVYGRGYRFVAPSSAVAPKPGSTRTSHVPARSMAERPGAPPLLAVPPFDDSALGSGDGHLAAVLHEEVLIALSRFRDIRLVLDADAGKVAPEGWGERDYRLGVRLVHGEDSIRAFARMSRLASGEIIWADQVSLLTAAPMGGVEDMARRVAAAALPRLHDDILRNIPPRGGDDAYDRYFATRLRMRSAESLTEASAVASEWEALIQEHPSLVQAYPPLIRLYNTDFGFLGPGSTDQSHRRRAYELAHRAIAIDGTDSHLHSVKGWCHLWAGEPALARRHFEDAARLNPYHQARLVELATGFMFLDDLDRASDLLENCRSLAAFAGEEPHEEEGLLRLLRGDYLGAGVSLGLARRVHPDAPPAIAPSTLADLYALLAAAGAQGGDLDRRAGEWIGALQERWAGEEPLDGPRIKQWILQHNPFQEEARRQWLCSLIDVALAAARPGRRRTRAQAPPGISSAPRAPAVPSS